MADSHRLLRRTGTYYYRRRVPLDLIEAMGIQTRGVLKKELLAHLRATRAIRRSRQHPVRRHGGFFKQIPELFDSQGCATKLGLRSLSLSLGPLKSKRLCLGRKFQDEIAFLDDLTRNEIHGLENAIKPRRKNEPLNWLDDAFILAQHDNNHTGRSEKFPDSPSNKNGIVRIRWKRHDVMTFRKLELLA